jgi:hypothetical protein
MKREFGMGKYQLYGSSYKYIQFAGFISIVIGISGLVFEFSVKPPNQTIQIVFAILIGLGGISLRFKFRPTTFQTFEPIKGDEGKTVTIAAIKRDKYWARVIVYLLGALLAGGAFLIIGLVIYSPFARSSQGLFEEAALLPLSCTSLVLAASLSFFWIKRVLEESRLYQPTMGQELVLTPELFKCSIGVIYDREIINGLIESNKSYLVIPWKEMKSFAVFQDNIESRAPYRPPLYCIDFSNDTVQIIRNFFSGKEEQIFDYVRSRNIRIVSDDNPL